MTDRKPMKEISHAHPETGETFGYDVYRRGPAVADGGENRDDAADEMSDVDHTPRDGEGANEVWKRGDGDVDE
ncbi:hypothetical protein [Halopelagius longus]|uniref:Uncharacterized protein n=1 Tax=Halopelagius longus TaxID=1236180 RepID=A0A1H1APU9_9EURY|nr:hypothetical protein [Halopelagius longus]RDI70471.1 hypothetical protein DWB78_01345 [Halopelagius longus]SDQ41707.1 hypothetical protein SAMN05216278_1439 [Halopelagius longus]